MPVAQVVPTPQMASKRKSTAACNGSNGLSTTGSAPRVQRPMKAAKSPAVRPSGNETAATKPVPSSIPEDYPFEHKDNIACPFPKHNPDRYTHVRESCTIGWGFSDTGKLNEHIRRVHTRSFGCLRCGHRFTNISKPKLSEAKAAHKCSKETTAGKEFKPDPRFGPEWLDERQEAAYFDLNFARGNSSEAPQVVFERIFNALWPEVPQKDIPSHLHMPGFFQATHKVEQMRQEMNRQAKQLRQSGQEKDQQIEALKEQIRNMNAMAMQRYGWHPQRESGPAIPTALLTSKHKANRIYNADLVPGMRQTPSFSTDPRTLGNILSDTLPPEFAFTVRDDGPPSLDSGLGSTGHSEGEAGPFSGMMATQDPSLSPQNWMDSNLLPDHNYELITEYSKSGIYPAYLNTSDSDELAMVLDPSWPPIEMEIEI